ncbi:MAG TPA: hypothetical protein VN207_02695 [Ktedonobacteraceae bacterium]|nr:hypothetical protein [Ktedonobacteraceae bacterium]
MSQSEVARIREQIAAEYQSVQQVFGGFTPTAKHEFITQRQENLANHFEELKEQVGPEEAMRIFIQMSEQRSN